MTTLDFLRDYGKFFSINYMLSKEIVASRLEAGISFTEFSYQILQSIDFLTLYRKYGCKIQIGGNDQWGNLTSGLELIRKLEGDNAPCEVMTAHLLLRSDGKKFGKSEQGALFLDPKLTSPYQLYQYFINGTDEDAVKYLKVLTFLPRTKSKTSPASTSPIRVSELPRRSWPTKSQGNPWQGRGRRSHLNVSGTLQRRCCPSEGRRDRRVIGLAQVPA
jgi:tyrosyl-tRNA synthetase